MHIFIDESGSFSGSANKQHALSCVGALVIPDFRLDQVFDRYKRLKKRLPKKAGEVKGSFLNESEVAAITDLLAKNDVVLEVVIFDSATQSAQEITKHKLEQARLMTRDLTDQHHPVVVGQVVALSERLKELSNQLYAQLVATTVVVERTVEHSTIYHSQRNPKELGAFHWVLDAKAPDGITSGEELWRFMVCPMIQSSSRNRPMKMLSEGDYSYFDLNFRTNTPEYLIEHGYSPGEGIDIGKLMNESIQFSDSKDKLGLQLADIVVNATRRALVGNLKVEGWRGLSRLMFSVRGQSIQMISLESSETRKLGLQRQRVFPYSDTINVLSQNSKKMLAPRFR